MNSNEFQRKIEKESIQRPLPVSKNKNDLKLCAVIHFFLQVLDVMTNGDIPEGPPLEVKVEAISSTQLKVSWLPPEKHLWNGEILGYHIGYKEKK